MVATVLVRGRNSEGVNALPERQDVARVADILGIAGFKILRVGRLGVSLEGTEELFEKVLGVDCSNGRPGVYRAVSPNRELRDLVELVEIAPPPTYFTNG